MSSRARRITAIMLFALVVVMARELGTSAPAQAISGVNAAAAVERGPARLSVERASAGVEDIDTSDTVDSYGNEVTRAIATYKFDSTGSLYELHSPQTQLPRLASPKT